MSFHDLGLSKGLIDALASKNYSIPTPIQREAIPLVLSGRDLLGIAQTGTGKTAAFILPAIDRLLASARGRPMVGSTRMLVLAPTRELAAQIGKAARAYAATSRISVGVIFGGVPVGKSIREVSRGLDILVATPGRLLDLVDQRALSLSALEILVLDEADQMLDLGFIHALKAIVKLIPAKRQTLFFSATMPTSIRKLADVYLSNPVKAAVAPVATTAERVRQSVIFVNQAEKQALLTMFIQSAPIERALVFSRTKHGADKIVRFLSAAGIDANALHGNKSQAQRERSLDLFRSGETPILVATDIAARGIDIPGVSHVINFDLPNVPEQYVHRIGRTARAGAEGTTIAFCSDEERAFLRDIERLTRQRIDVEALPEDLGSTVEALKRLKPSRSAPERKPVHSSNRSSTKADRRADGQRREHRNDRIRQPKWDSAPNSQRNEERTGSPRREMRGPALHRSEDRNGNVRYSTRERTQENDRSEPRERRFNDTRGERSNSMRNAPPYGRRSEDRNGPVRHEPRNSTAHGHRNDDRKDGGRHQPRNAAHAHRTDERKDAARHSQRNAGPHAHRSEGREPARRFSGPGTKSKPRGRFVQR